MTLDYSNWDYSNCYEVQQTCESCVIGLYT